MIKKFASVVAAGAASALLIAGAASAATQGKTIASCSAKGRQAHCVAANAVRHPLRLYVHVRARPSQQVIGAWAVVCFKGSRRAEKTGRFNAKADPTLTRRIAMSYRHPDKCNVAGDAGILRNGRSIHVWLTVVK